MFNDLLVVICFKILIFVTTDTTTTEKFTTKLQLWFALKFLSLLLQIQHEAKIEGGENVVICFKILIFVTTDTTRSFIIKPDN